MDLILSRRRPTNFGCLKPVRPYVLPIFIHLPRETGLPANFPPVPPDLLPRPDFSWRCH